MPDVVLTFSKHDPNPDFTVGNKRVRFRSVALNTGDYVADGIPVEADEFGLKRFAVLVPLGGVRKDTDYATGWPVNVRYNSERTIAYLIMLESAADGDPMDEKPAEACVASTIEFMAIGH